MQQINFQEFWAGRWNVFPPAAALFYDHLPHAYSKTRSLKVQPSNFQNKCLHEVICVSRQSYSVCVCVCKSECERASSSVSAGCHALREVSRGRERRQYRPYKSCCLASSVEPSPPRMELPTYFAYMCGCVSQWYSLGGLDFRLHHQTRERARQGKRIQQQS